MPEPNELCKNAPMMRVNHFKMVRGAGRVLSDEWLELRVTVHAAFKERAVGLEPTPCCLENSGSAIELHSLEAVVNVCVADNPLSATG